MSPQEMQNTAAQVETTVREEIPGANEALKKIGWSIFVGVVGTVANAIPQVVPIIHDVVVPKLPAILQNYGGVAISSGALALMALLNQLARHDTKKAVSIAYVSEPDAKTAADIKKVYNQ